MYGAILGDIIGSPFEFDRGNKSKEFSLFSTNSRFTDDSVMTIAVAHAFLDAQPNADIEWIRLRLISSMKKYGKLFPRAGYGGMFRRWLKSDDPQPYGSFGNGSAMRVSSVAWIYNDLETVRSMARLSAEVSQELLVHVNLAMQTLDEQGLSPYRTFDSISKFAELLGASRGKAFAPRISNHKITDNTEIILIEPPCGSNTAIINSNGKLLFVDSGYACYGEEMLSVIRRLFPKFDETEKTVLVTHADVDHCGLLPIFDKIIASEKTARCLNNEYIGKNGYREENPLHKPYINICKILTSYKAVDPQRITVIGDSSKPLTEPLTQIGFFDFEELHFEIYEGKGGHLPGEIVLIDYAHHIAFTGDVYINLHGLTPEQAEYNQYAPILMTSVDTDPKLCAEERKAILGRLGVGRWQIFGAHGFKKDYSVSI